VSVEVVAVVVVALAGIAAGTIRLAVHERRVRRRAEEAAAATRRLEAVAEELAAALTPRQVLDAVVSAGLDAADARAGAILVVEEDGETVAVAAQRGFDDRLAEWSRFPLGAPLAATEAIRTGTPIYLESGSAPGRPYPEVAAEGELGHALAALPLVVDRRTFGALLLGFAGDERFPPERRALKEALAAQVAQALERARLYDVEHRLRQRSAFLADASELLASSLDYEGTLDRLTQLCVPALGDWCTIVMSDGDRLERVAVSYGDPSMAAAAEAFSARYEPEGTSPAGVGRVVATGEPVFVPRIDDELLVGAAHGDVELLDALRALSLRSTIVAPLRARGRTLGALTVATRDRVYDEGDLQVAVDLARRAAVAVDNARLHAEVERRADAARALDHVADAVVLVDAEGVPRYWNRSAARLVGARDGALTRWGELAAVLAQVDPEGRSGRTVPFGADGAERWLQVARSDFESGSVFALRDVTDERLLERTRSEFVATASHELRTPIASVYGAFQTLLRPDLAPEDPRRREFLKMGLQESERLARIVDDLLLAGQLDAGAPAVNTTERCDLGTLVEEVVASAAVRANGGHRLVADVAPGLESVPCDAARLRQVLVNLVENAVKYSPGGGTVTVRAAPRGDAVALEVADEGIGIPDRDRRRIFDRFVRLDPTLSRGVGGTGLGLYISRELVERMGGRIDVRSAEGAGSTFTVLLPTRS
jgi:signal transduction histidine kinase